MANEIEALQGDMANQAVSVTALLQKALVLASKLEDNEFVAWARHELKGYTKDEKEVEYRCLKGQYVVVTPDDRTTPIHWSGSPSRMNDRFLTAPIAELESLIGRHSDRFVVKIQADPQTFTSLNLQPGDYVGFEVVRSTLTGFLQTIRNHILDWTLSHPVAKAVEPLDNRYKQLAARLLQVEDFPLLLPPLSFKNTGDCLTTTTSDCAP